MAPQRSRRTPRNAERAEHPNNGLCDRNAVDAPASASAVALVTRKSAGTRKPQFKIRIIEARLLAGKPPGSAPPGPGPRAGAKCEAGGSSPDPFGPSHRRGNYGRILRSNPRRRAGLRQWMWLVCVSA